MTKKEIVHCLDEFALYHAKGDLPNSARTVQALEETIKKLKEEIRNEELYGMSAEEFCEIFQKGWPALFRMLYDECEFVYKDRRGIETKLDWEYGEAALIEARAILSDYGREQARKIGKLLVDASE